MLYQDPVNDALDLRQPQELFSDQERAGVFSFSICNYVLNTFIIILIFCFFSRSHFTKKNQAQESGADVSRALWGEVPDAILLSSRS